MKKSEIKITRIILEKDGIEYIAKPATNEQKKLVEEKMKAAGRSLNCECGEEFCDGEWLWRCMYSGGGICDWYITYIVCA